MWERDRVRSTCEYFSVESLDPVIPQAQSDHRLQTVECPHPDLGEKIVWELQFSQGSLTPELVPAETPQRVPEIIWMKVGGLRGSSVLTWRSWCWPAECNSWGWTPVWLSGCQRCPGAQYQDWESGEHGWGSRLNKTVGLFNQFWRGGEGWKNQARFYQVLDWLQITSWYWPQSVSVTMATNNRWKVILVRSLCLTQCCSRGHNAVV